MVDDRFGADLLRHPEPPPAPPRRRERIVPIGYTLFFAVVFGLFTYVCLINWAIDAVGLVKRVLGW